VIGTAAVTVTFGEVLTVVLSVDNVVELFVVGVATVVIT